MKSSNLEYLLFSTHISSSASDDSELDELSAFFGFVLKLEIISLATLSASFMSLLLVSFLLLLFDFFSRLSLSLCFLDFLLCFDFFEDFLDDFFFFFFRDLRLSELESESVSEHSPSVLLSVEGDLDLLRFFFLCRFLLSSPSLSFRFLAFQSNL